MRDAVMTRIIGVAWRYYSREKITNNTDEDIWSFEPS